MEGKKFDGWTRRRVGWGLSGMAAGLLGTATGQDSEAKKKKCKKSKDCPDSCEFIVYSPTDVKFCGSGYSTKAPCVPCTSQGDCSNADYPHCLDSWRFIGNENITYFTDCPGSTAGVCGRVLACAT